MASILPPAFAARYIRGLADRHSAAGIYVYFKESVKMYFAVSANALMSRRWTD